MIAIPRILVFPKSEVKSGFKPFALELGALNLQAPSDELWVQHLRTNQLEIIGLLKGGVEEERLEDYVVSGLVDFDDISYDDHADLLYGLAGQTVGHFAKYLSADDAKKVLRFHQRKIADFVHVQMQDHYWEDEGVDYQVTVSAGFTELKRRNYTQLAGDPQIDFRQQPPDLSHIDRYLFKGFRRGLYTEEKFQSDTERRFAVILDRETEKWFKPAKGQFQIFYKSGAYHLEYQPDFVAETKDSICMLESKAKNQMEDVIVLAKKDAAVKWCEQAGAHSATCGGKPWKYALIPHDAVAENMTLAGLVSQFGSDS